MSQSGKTNEHIHLSHLFGVHGERLCFVHWLPITNSQMCLICPQLRDVQSGDLSDVLLGGQDEVKGLNKVLKKPQVSVCGTVHRTKLKSCFFFLLCRKKSKTFLKG